MTRLRRILIVLVIAICASAIGQVVIIYQLSRLQEAFTARPAARTAAGEPPLPAAPISLDGAAVKGAAAAPIAVVEFADFECRYCGEFATGILPVLEREYIDGGKVLYAFRHFPLKRQAGTRHPAQAAACAAGQGRFWEMHHAMFGDRAAVASGAFADLAASAGLAQDTFQQCLDGRPVPQIMRDLQAARGLGVTSTPTFFVGRRNGDGTVRVTARFQGLRPIEEFRAAFDAVLSSQ